MAKTTQTECFQSLPKRDSRQKHCFWPILVPIIKQSKTRNKNISAKTFQKNLCQKRLFILSGFHDSVFSLFVFFVLSRRFLIPSGPRHSTENDVCNCVVAHWSPMIWHVAIYKKNIVWETCCQSIDLSPAYNRTKSKFLICWN